MQSMSSSCKVVSMFLLRLTSKKEKRKIKRLVFLFYLHIHLQIFLNFLFFY